MLRMAIAGTMIVLAGLLMAGLSGYDLGVARAARALRIGVAAARAARPTTPEQGAPVVSFGSAGRPHLGTGPLAVAAIGLGLVLATAGAGAVVWPVPVGTAQHWALVAGAGVLVLAVGLIGVTKLVRRVEISAYAKGAALLPVLVPTIPMPTEGAPVANLPTPSTVPTDDRGVPDDAQLGWVYRDVIGTWLMVVAAEDGEGRRFVRLTDFRLLPPGAAQLPLEIVGAVELAVWPLTPPGPTG
ncbi:hypothetical protein Lfu02_30950 [Longispora fulva]|uniref:Uncharacterized protein n=1 Tax=Longispora fulva TaxID=619741 RepID=A0A8J7GVB9_9ACTN|nr:hypothetical protein [Longispora fulva]MBG6139229.1 hypothetical protein [Longispora fulva]GIG58723.1 hypothetical protein Lfu02_30950 [Longispora fulva]